jgi:TonB-dependent receptor
MFSENRRAGSRWLAAALLTTTMFSAPALAGSLSGTVVDGSGTSGLQGAEIDIVELGRSTSAGPDGVYRFADVPAGTYTLRARYSGADERSETVVVTETGTTSANIILGAHGDRESTILVIGQRANLGSSISRQRAADGVSTVLTRDAVGQFPDQNVAEALRRAPGINVLNDQGEGRFVSVRGLDPNLNSTSINGNRVLATGGDERAAALDVIPSELVESIEIKKTLTPDMDGDTLGGSIEINTTSAFDRKKGFVSLKAEGSYNDLRDAVSPKVGLDFSTRLGDNFGISGGLNYNKRIFGSDNIEMGGWTMADNGVVYAEDLEYRDYDVTRERIGGSLSLDARVGDTTELYARGVYSRFDDREFRRRLVFGFDGEPASGTDTSATFDSADDRIEVRRDLKDRQEIQTIKTISVGGKTETGPWRITYDAAWSEARQFEDGSVDPIRFRRRFEDPGELGVTIDTSRLQRPGYDINYGEAGFLDPVGYRPTLLERTTDENARDREYSFRGDVARSFALANGTFEIQGGVKARFRNKSLDFTIDLFDDFDGSFTLADVLGRQSYGLAAIDPVPGPQQWRDFYEANGTLGMGRNDLESDWASAAEDYRAKEDILAGYLLGRFDNSVVRIIGGLRVERTRNEFFANRLEVNEDAETLAITPVQYQRDYTDWLPSLNIRYAPSRDLVLRGGIFRSVMRPKLADIAPRFVVEENEDGEREGTFGNPDLNPYRAWNFDVTAEYYFARNAVVQGGLFYKQIDDFIVEAKFEGSPTDPFIFNGIPVLEGSVPVNGERATVKGFEFAYQQALDFLPGALDGLLVNLNYTYTDAKGRLADGALTSGRRIPLAASSKHTINGVLGYEKGRVSLRLSGAYRSGYLDEIGGDADEDRYVRDHFQLDLTAKYQLTKNVQLVGELVNILDEPYTTYQRFEGRDRLMQYEEYGITAKFGVRASF